MKTFVAGLIVLLATFAVAEEKSGSMDQNDKWGEEILLEIDASMHYRSITVSPKGDTVAASMQLRNRETPTEELEKVILITRGERRELPLPPDVTPRWAPCIDSLMFSSDGKILYGYRVATCRVVAWDVASGEKVPREFAEGSFPWSFTLNPTLEGPGMALKEENGSRQVSRFPTVALAIECWGKDRTAQEIQLRDINDQPLGRTIPVGQLVAAIEFAPNGSFVAVVGKETLCLIDCIKVNQEVKPKHFKLSAHGYGVSIAPDNHTVAVGTADGLFIFDRSQPPNAKPIALRGHGPFHVTGKPSVRCVKFLRDGTLVSGGGDDTVRLWDVEKKECLVVFQQGAGVQDLAVSADGYAIFSAGIDGRIKRFYRKGMAPDTFMEAATGEQAQK